MSVGGALRKGRAFPHIRRQSRKQGILSSLMVLEIIEGGWFNPNQPPSVVVEISVVRYCVSSDVNIAPLS
jgi:hypothetical protein